MHHVVAVVEGACNNNWTMSPRRNRITPHTILSAERTRRALELRKLGLTYQQISEEIEGLNSPQSARAAVKRGLDAIPIEDATELRKINLQRLDSFLLSIWGKTQAGDERAIQTALAVMERMDKLVGTEASRQVDVHVEGGVLVIEGKPEDYTAGLQRMAELSGAGPRELEEGETRNSSPQNQTIDSETIDSETIDLEITDDGIYAQADSEADSEADFSPFDEDDGVIEVIEDDGPIEDGPIEDDGPIEFGEEDEDEACGAYLRPSGGGKDLPCARCGQIKSAH
jgi:hypothetical protein